VDWSLNRDSDIGVNGEAPGTADQRVGLTSTSTRKRRRQNSSSIARPRQQKPISHNPHVQNFLFEITRTLKTRSGIEDFMEKLKEDAQNTQDLKEIARVEASSVMLKGLAMLAQGPNECLDQKQVIACFRDLWNAARVGTPPLIGGNLDEDVQDPESGLQNTPSDGDE